MTITKGSVVLFDYTLTDDDKELIDSSKDAGPLAYLQGESQIVKGLEKAMEGKSAGDSFKISIAPEEGYGLIDPEKIAVVDADQIEGGDELEEGMQLEASHDSEEDEQVVVVSKIEGKKVTLDGNHPLAGMNLHFDIKIREVRAATAEEIEHGHVHGDGGHHH
ncbi:MAG: peptidylprolyl isomerase [Chthoniobacterales bacterium]|jgi:FKBP-type peptidyl-prolyl cis-trans isomerase SlyD|nr:peptidylprolyl isomerase [Chthoniobacterales bacterium]